jgi:L-arabinose transport system substrate-binding protein
MNLSRKRFVFALTALGAAACARSTDDRVKIGFIVKQPEEPWFQDEWRFAGKAADQYGFELIRIGATDGERVLSAIHNLAASGARGFVICAPDTRLGAAILQNARANDLKVMSVDDRLLGADGKPIEEIPHVGISAQAIGRQVGETIAAEARARNWRLSEIGLLRITFDNLQTARERTIGARDALVAAGLPAARVFEAPQRTSDTEGGFNAAGPVLTRQSAIRRWAIVGMNDETVVGGVRAAEDLGLGAGDAIAVGINGGATAQAEFVKPDRTAFFATILLSARRHGFDTAEAMYRWVADGVEPQRLVLTSGIVMNRENWRRLKAEQEA